MKPLLDLTDVNYTYQTAEGETPAVKNLSFRVFPDHFLGIIGPSGCGKSTILSLIAGLIQPNSGKIAVSAEIGYMLQKDHLLDWLSIKDNITLGPRIHHKLTPEKESWADKMLEEFSELVDPKSGNPLMDRTTLIANTSNMPVAAREASIYTGLTLAEYYRDMGYDVAIMADSTSRWAEALRELSGRLEEMPAEEGFPAYLASRLSAFYERAGMMHNLNGSDGSVTIIGAVSPQGGDFSEPVTQNTKRFVRCFWGLDKSLAYARHFPAIHWLTSYSEYLTDLAAWYHDNVSPKFVDYRNRIMALLNQESSLMEIVKLIGSDVLPDDQKLVLEIARVIRLGFLQQNAFHKDDTCVSLQKQYKMMEIILYLYKRCRELVAMNMPMSVLKEENIFERVIAIKYDVPNDNLQLLDQYLADIDAFHDRIMEKNA